MSLGILLKASNALYFRKKLDFYFEFIPQIVLLWCIFGYMITLILVKWLTFYDDTSIAPPIIGYMIDMFLKFGSITGDAIIHSETLNEALHVFLLFTSLLCIPTMLLVKPYIMYKEMQNHGNGQEYEMKEIQARKKNRYHRFEEDDDPQIEMPQEENKEFDDIKENKRGKLEEEYPTTDELKERLHNSLSDIIEEDNHQISEIAIHQLIETIEFVLGTVSNTASYLRLWALSLAHSQLAAVFFEKIIEGPLESNSAIGLFVLFPLFATATFGVLMSMDAMECFLHTLRLHWVEFQNKFFDGTGYKFVGFSLPNELEMRK